VSQLPAHPLTEPAIDFIISESPFISSGVGSSSSFSTLYLIKSTKPFSRRGSLVQCFLTSVIWTTLFRECRLSAVFIGFVIIIMSVALKLVVGTPRSFTTLSNIP